MNPQTIDRILNLAALAMRGAGELLRLFGKNWTGADKLAAELEATAANTEAFRATPVYRAEIEANRLSSTWDESST